MLYLPVRFILLSHSPFPPLPSSIPTPLLPPPALTPSCPPSIKLPTLTIAMLPALPAAATPPDTAPVSDGLLCNGLWCSGDKRHTSLPLPGPLSPLPLPMAGTTTAPPDIVFLPLSGFISSSADYLLVVFRNIRSSYGWHVSNCPFEFLGFWC